MESALPARPANRANRLGLAALALGAFAIGFVHDLISVKAALLVVFGALGAGLLFIPYSWAIRLLFLYLGVEGMLKMLTGYNPVVHVGSDLLILGITGRWIATYLLRKSRVPSDLPPLLPLFAAHVIWFLIEFANPHSLGLVPSLAGAKLYIVAPILYAFGYYLGREASVVRGCMAMWLVVAFLQVPSGLYQGAVGPSSVLSLSPAYAAPLQKFAGYAFRPFGTTHLPGGPGIFIALSSVFLVYFLMRSRSAALKGLLLAYVPLAILLLVLCQVRVMIFKSIVGIGLFLFLAFLRSEGRARARYLASIAVAAALALAILPVLTQRWVEQRGENAAAIERSLSLFDYSVASKARKGALDRIIYHATEVPLGAGLSRTGSAFDKFSDLAASDPFYPFAFFGDNFWASTIAEIGIPGSLILTLLIGTLIARAASSALRAPDAEQASLRAAVLCALVMVVVGLWGGEGILYNPEAPYFWFFAGVAMQMARPAGTAVAFAEPHDETEKKRR